MDIRDFRGNRSMYLLHFVTIGTVIFAKTMLQSAEEFFSAPLKTNSSFKYCCSRRPQPNGNAFVPLR